MASTDPPPTTPGSPGDASILFVDRDGLGLLAASGDRVRVLTDTITHADEVSLCPNGGIVVVDNSRQLLHLVSPGGQTDIDLPGPVGLVACGSAAVAFETDESVVIVEGLPDSPSIRNVPLFGGESLYWDEIPQTLTWVGSDGRVVEIGPEGGFIEVDPATGIGTATNNRPISSEGIDGAIGATVADSDFVENLLRGTLGTLRRIDARTAPAAPLGPAQIGDGTVSSDGGFGGVIPVAAIAMAMIAGATGFWFFARRKPDSEGFGDNLYGHIGESGSWQPGNITVTTQSSTHNGFTTETSSYTVTDVDGNEVLWEGDLDLAGDEGQGSGGNDGSDESFPHDGHRGEGGDLPGEHRQDGGTGGNTGSDESYPHDGHRGEGGDLPGEHRQDDGTGGNAGSDESYPHDDDLDDDDLDDDDRDDDDDLDDDPDGQRR